MSSFNDVLNNDLQNAFFNNKEFCGFHTVNGTKMHVIFDKHALEDRQPAKDADGIYTDALLIFVPLSDFGGKPKIGFRINLDGKKNYSVKNIDEQNGLLCLTLEEYSS